MSLAEYRKLDYPLNMMRTIFGDKYYKCPKDIDAAISKVLETFTPMAEEVMLLYFRDKLSLASVGNKINRNIERIRQIIHKVSFKIRNTPDLCKYLFLGCEVTENNIRIPIRSIGLAAECINKLTERSYNYTDDLRCFSVDDILESREIQREEDKRLLIHYGLLRWRTKTAMDDIAEKLKYELRLDSYEVYDTNELKKLIKHLCQNVFKDMRMYTYVNVDKSKFDLSMEVGERADRYIDSSVKKMKMAIEDYRESFDDFIKELDANVDVWAKVEKLLRERPEKYKQLEAMGKKDPELSKYSVRIQNVFAKYMISDSWIVSQLNEKDFRGMVGLGDKSIAEIMDKRRVVKG